MSEGELVTVLLVRHGESAWNALGRWQGQADPALSSHGEQQALRAARTLADRQIDRIVASDLQRARETASLIARHLGLAAPLLDRALREVDVGEWTGLTRPQIEARWPQLMNAWARGRLERTPGGESLTQVRDRVTRAIAAIVESERRRGVQSTVLVISHRRAISTLEETAGVTPVRAGHLAGRAFLSANPGELTAGQPLDLLA